MRLVQKALTFDDVLLVPAYSEVLPRDTSLATRLSRNITLNIPLVSAAMDTVTESRLAIAMAQEGGIGIIHKNLSADAQAREVARVKRHEFGIVIDPVTVTPDEGARRHRAAAPARHLRPAGGRRRQAGRYRHQPRPALRREPRPAAAQHHDPAGSPGHDEGRRDAGRSPGPDAQASPGARADRQRRLRAAAWPRSRTSSRTPSIRSPTRTPWASCAWARRWAWAPAPKSASRSWSPRASTC